MRSKLNMLQQKKLNNVVLLNIQKNDLLFISYYDDRFVFCEQYFICQKPPRGSLGAVQLRDLETNACVHWYLKTKLVLSIKKSTTRMGFEPMSE